MKQGFTLIELVIVVVVMSVLSFITYEQFDFARIKARDVQRKSDLGSVSTAIQMYFADYGHVPSTSVKGDPDINKLWGKTFVDKDYVYLKSVPEEKYQKNLPYCYATGSTGDNFTLYAELENKKDPDCKEDKFVCNGKSYCYADTVYPEKLKDNK